MLAYPVAISSNPDWRNYTPGTDHDARSSYPASLFVAEYTLTEQVRSMTALIDTFALMYPQLQDVDFRRDVPRLGVPVYVVEGGHEAPGRAVLAREWFAALSAPGKELVEFNDSGHTPHLDEPGRFAKYMVDVVLTQTTSASRSDECSAGGLSFKAPTMTARSSMAGHTVSSRYYLFRNNTLRN